MESEIYLSISCDGREKEETTLVIEGENQERSFRNSSQGKKDGVGDDVLLFLSPFLSLLLFFSFLSQTYDVFEENSKPHSILFLHT